jgi:hypothetical protein
MTGQHPFRRLHSVDWFRLIFIGLGMPLALCSWGFSSHRCIHDAAIQALPEPLHAFFKEHRSWLVTHAVDADLRKHAVVGEAEKHFIDLDLYGFSMDSLKHHFPRDEEDARLAFGDSTLIANGTGPWSALRTYHRLVASFSRKDEAMILRHAADLGHYVSDLHVPLHTTSNYNGAQTGQHGIHSLWETQLPELFIDTYQLTPGIDCNLPAARYIADPQLCLWNATFDSHQAVDSVLYFEAMLSHELGRASTHAYVERGRTHQRMRTFEFASQYHQALSGQVERRMQQSIYTVSSLWYSAWVDAGQPDMPRPTIHQDLSWIKRLNNWLFR